MAKANQNTKPLKLDENETFETGEAITLDDGGHQGVIASVHGEQSQNRSTGETYRYLQLVINPASQPEMKLRYGCPLPEGRPITPASKLGKLLLSFGVRVEPGASYSIAQMRQEMEGKTVSFLVINAPSKTGDGTFANVVEDSIKPVKAKK